MRFHVIIKREVGPAEPAATQATAVRLFHPRSRLGRPAVCAMALTALGLASTGVATASAAQIPATIPIAPTPPPPVKSVTVSTTGFAYCAGTPGLAFPNGACDSPTYTVTNGTSPAQIDVNGADAIPSDAGAHWVLTNTLPGPDQYVEVVGDPALTTSPGTALTNNPQCDIDFSQGTSPCGPSAAGVSHNANVQLTGPKSSTDTATTFSTTITYTAI